MVVLFNRNQADWLVEPAQLFFVAFASPRGTGSQTNSIFVSIFSLVFKTTTGTMITLYLTVPKVGRFLACEHYWQLLYALVFIMNLSSQSLISYFTTIILKRSRPLMCYLLFCQSRFREISPSTCSWVAKASLYVCNFICLFMCYVSCYCAVFCLFHGLVLIVMNFLKCF